MKRKILLSFLTSVIVATSTQASLDYLDDSPTSAQLQSGITATSDEKLGTLNSVNVHRRGANGVAARNGQAFPAGIYTGATMVAALTVIAAGHGKTNADFAIPQGVAGKTYAEDLDILRKRAFAVQFSNAFTTSAVNGIAAAQQADGSSMMTAVQMQATLGNMINNDIGYFVAAGAVTNVIVGNRAKEAFDRTFTLEDALTLLGNMAAASVNN